MFKGTSDISFQSAKSFIGSTKPTKSFYRKLSFFSLEHLTLKLKFSLWFYLRVNSRFNFINSFSNHLEITGIFPSNSHSSAAAIDPSIVDCIKDFELSIMRVRIC